MNKSPEEVLKEAGSQAAIAAWHWFASLLVLTGYDARELAVIPEDARVAISVQIVRLMMLAARTHGRNLAHIVGLPAGASREQRRSQSADRLAELCDALRVDIAGKWGPPLGADESLPEIDPAETEAANRFGIVAMLLSLKVEVAAGAGEGDTLNRISGEDFGVKINPRGPCGSCGGAGRITAGNMVSPCFTCGGKGVR